MPVTTRAASVAVKSVQHGLPPLTPLQILELSCPAQYYESDGLLGTSFDDPERQMQYARNGFVNCTLDAYLQHNHLVLRPEDLWFAILTQFSFYVNGHAEELRSFFVAHKGKKKLKVEQDGEMDLEAFALKMTGLIAENIKDPSLREWMMPSFTTTTATDKMVASIIMMGSMQKYFMYFLDITCGIPSVTLLGEKRDWVEILDRLEFLNTFNGHEQLQLWYGILKPIVTHFVRTFDAPGSPEIVRFWEQTVHHYITDYGADKYITGWILAFCFWDTEGKPLAAKFWIRNPNLKNSVKENQSDLLSSYGDLQWENIPAGFAHVPVHIRIQSETKFEALMVAGSVGWRVLDSDTIFPTKRQLTEGTISPRPSSSKKVKKVIVWKVLRKLFCQAEHEEPADEKLAPSLGSSLTEFEDWDKGGKQDTLQPVCGWWAIKKKGGQYGKDEDCPDVQFDSDAEDYDRELAENGEPWEAQ
jgi:hypothetical protein